MINMETTVRQIRAKHPRTKIIIGGAPVTQEFATKIGADGYSPDPQGAVEYINTHGLQN
jgi:5-methyltetrahydrofolate--homocysteine methyltransferase